MNPDELINTLEDAAGFITSSADGTCTCVVCGATGNDYAGAIQHDEGCPYKKAVDMLLDNLPAIPDNVIPGVENRISVAMLLPYYADLSKSELSEIERMTKGMMFDVPIEDRMTTSMEISHWCPNCDPELLQRMIENGIKSEKARITIRNYFVFERVTAKKIKKIEDSLAEAQAMQNELEPMFEKLLIQKYGYERYTDLPKE